MLTRRQLIKTGMAGSVVLLAAGLLATPQADCRPGRHAAAFPAAADAQILRSIARSCWACPACHWTNRARGGCGHQR
jgi:hypothetical protein